MSECLVLPHPGFIVKGREWQNILAGARPPGSSGGLARQPAGKSKATRGLEGGARHGTRGAAISPHALRKWRGRGPQRLAARRARVPATAKKAARVPAAAKKVARVPAADVKKAGK